MSRSEQISGLASLPGVALSTMASPRPALIAVGLGLLVILQFYGLDRTPPGFFTDEAAIGYSAWSMAETGADEYGNRWPMFFRCFDNYHDPAMVYFLTPILKVTGPQAWWVRFPSALFHLLAAGAIGLLAYEYCRRADFAYVTAAVFVILPWAFPISRCIMSGYTAMLFGMTLGWWGLVHAARTGSRRSAIVAGFAWALAMYAHNIGRPICAMLLCLFVLAYNRELLARLKTAGTFALTLVLVMLPMAVAVLTSPALTERFKTIAVWSDLEQPTIWNVTPMVLHRYFQYFSPQFLFLEGDNQLRHHSGHGGMLFLFMAPLVLAGLWHCVRGLRSKPHYRFLLLCLGAYPIMASLTMSMMHSTRTLNGCIPWTLVAVLGAYQLRGVHKKWPRLLLVFGILAGIEITSYTLHYFTVYPQAARHSFDAHDIELIREARGRLQDGDTLYVSNSIFQHPLQPDFRPYMYAHFLFFLAVPPAKYQAEGMPARIRMYDGKRVGPGLLLRSDRMSPIIPEKENAEPVPPGAVLQHHFRDAGVEYQIWRVP